MRQRLWSSAILLSLLLSATYPEQHSRTAAALGDNVGDCATVEARAPLPQRPAQPPPVVPLNLAIPKMITSLNNQTIRMIVRASIGGRRARRRTEAGSSAVGTRLLKDHALIQTKAKRRAWLSISGFARVANSTPSLISTRRRATRTIRNAFARNFTPEIFYIRAQPGIRRWPTPLRFRFSFRTESRNL